MISIPFLDLKAATLELQPELDAALRRVMRSGRYLLGEETAAFETEFAAYCGVRHCIATSNGLDALHLILRAWDIGAGDEVIVPAHTFIASWLAVTYAGARPVPVDVDEQMGNLDPSRIEDAITPRTRAIMPVHLHGQVVDMDPVRGIASRHGLRILEDAAQAHGAKYRGRCAGALGDAAAFSFYPGKNLGALGDGGAITTDDDSAARRVRMLANYGAREKYQHLERGYNCRLDEVQAAILRVKLRHLEMWNDRRRAIATRYLSELAGTIQLPGVLPHGEPAWHLFVVRSPERDELQRVLAATGIETLIHYPTPPFLQPAYAEFAADADRWPVAQRWARETLSLPMGPHLGPDPVDRVIAAVQDWATVHRR